MDFKKPQEFPSLTDKDGKILYINNMDMLKTRNEK